MEAYAAPSPSAKPRYRLRLVEGRWTCIPLPLGPPPPLPAPAKPKRSPVSKAMREKHPPGRSPALGTIPCSSGADGSENNRASTYRARSV